MWRYNRQVSSTPTFQSGTSHTPKSIGGHPAHIHFRINFKLWSRRSCGSCSPTPALLSGLSLSPPSWQLNVLPWCVSAGSCTLTLALVLAKPLMQLLCCPGAYALSAWKPEEWARFWVIHTLPVNTSSATDRWVLHVPLETDNVSRAAPELLCFFWFCKEGTA